MYLAPILEMQFVPLIFGPSGGIEVGLSHGSPKLKFSKHSHVIYHRKAFLMLISDFEFILPDFGFLVLGERVNYYINHILVYNPVANSDVYS